MILWNIFSSPLGSFSSLRFLSMSNRMLLSVDVAYVMVVSVGCYAF